MHQWRNFPSLWNVLARKIVPFPKSMSDRVDRQSGCACHSGTLPVKRPLERSPLNFWNWWKLAFLSLFGFLCLVTLGAHGIELHVQRIRGRRQSLVWIEKLVVTWLGCLADSGIASEERDVFILFTNGQRDAKVGKWMCYSHCWKACRSLLSLTDVLMAWNHCRENLCGSDGVSERIRRRLLRPCL